MSLINPIGDPLDGVLFAAPLFPRLVRFSGGIIVCRPEVHGAPSPELRDVDQILFGEHTGIIRTPMRQRNHLLLSPHSNSRKATFLGYGFRKDQET